VHHQDKGRRRIEGRAAHRQAIREVRGQGNLSPRIDDGLAVQEDRPVPDQGVDLAPGTIAKVGEEAVKPHGGGTAHRRAS
jgi:hypothetical protein